MRQGWKGLFLFCVGSSSGDRKTCYPDCNNACRSIRLAVLGEGVVRE